MLPGECEDSWGPAELAQAKCVERGEADGVPDPDVGPALPPVLGRALPARHHHTVGVHRQALHLLSVTCTNN